jgi:hypothetical protein
MDKYHMKKIFIFEQTVAATQQAIADIQAGNTPNIYSWGLWCEALLREVLYHDKQRIYAQDLENLQRETAVLFQNKESILSNLELFAQRLVNIESLIKDGNQKIEWEPPFDVMYNTIP